MTLDRQREGHAATWEELRKNPCDMRPHVLILGAGASRAALPNGDANGKRLPLMNDLARVVGLGPILKRVGFRWNGRGNFEKLYSRIHCQDPASPALRELEEEVSSFFGSMRLPPGPTLYDHLLLSLRPRDLVATFNWDPLLLDAYSRLRDRGIPIPGIALLHGNVRVGYCPDHRTKGEIGASCPECGRQFTPSRLLYPIAEKDYADPFIEREWDLLHVAMEHAFTLTIFGYSAPATDQKAIALMKGAWSGKGDRKFEQTEVIERKDEYTTRDLWRPFTYSGHFDYRTDFYQSCIGMFPRRSCEAQYERTAMGRFTPEPRQIPKEANWPELLEWFDPIFAEERPGD
jgi:hypothetical protein